MECYGMVKIQYIRLPLASFCSYLQLICNIYNKKLRTVVIRQYERNDLNSFGLQAQCHEILMNVIIVILNGVNDWAL
jgi:hypothetical protein